MARTITIGGSTYDIIENFPLSQNIGMEMDSAVVSFNLISFDFSGTTLFPKYTSVVLTLDTVSIYSLCISSYSYVQKYGYWTITLDLIEKTKILEEIFICGMAVTNESNLRNQIKSALAKINLVNPNIVLSLDTANYSWTSFVGASAEMFIFEKDWNAKEILDEMFSALKMEVRVSEINYSNNVTEIKIGFDNPASLGTSLPTTFITDNSISIIGSVDPNYDVGGIRAYAESCVSNQLITSPYLPLRCEEIGLYGTTKQIALTEKPIYSLTSFKCIALAGIYKYTHIYENDWQWIFESWTTHELDLTSYVVEKGYYDILPDTPSGVNIEAGYKYTSLYFERTKPNIRGFYEKYNQFGFNYYVLQNIDMIVQQNYIYYSSGGNDYKMLLVVYPGTYEINSISSGAYIPKFQSVYETNSGCYFDELKDTAVNTNITYNTRIIDNSSGSNVDVVRFSNSLINKTNRLGNRELTINKNYNLFTELKNTSDYVQYFSYKFIICKRDIRFNGQSIDVTYLLTNNYLPVNEKTTVKRTKETFTIPTSGYIDRYIQLEVSAIPDFVEIKTRNSLGLEIMLWDRGAMVCRKYESDDTYYSICEPLDNFSIGRYKDDISGTDTTVNLSYTTSSGTAYKFDIYGYDSDYIDTVSFDDGIAADYPKIADVDTPLDTPLWEYKWTLLSGDTSINVNKDRYERIIFVFYKRK